MPKSDSKAKKDNIEEPLIDQSNEVLKKLILKGKKKVFFKETSVRRHWKTRNLKTKKNFTQK